MSVEDNKRVARMYHDVRPEDVEKILTPDFIGRHRPGSDSTWTWAEHKEYITQNPQKRTVYETIAEGDWVATRFVVTGSYHGKPARADMMDFMRFAGGKITEIWEYFDWKQLPDE